MRGVLKALYATFMTHCALRPYPTGEDPTLVFAHALVGGGTNKEYKKDFCRGVEDEILPPLAVWQEYQKHCISEDGELYQAMLRETQYTGPARRLNGVRKEFYTQITASGGVAWRLMHYLGALFRYHTFFMTRAGYAGLAPLGTKENLTDRIAFIDGLKVPFVIRSFEEGLTNSKLVGPCYVHGMMDAEAARMNDALLGRKSIHLL